MTTATPTQPRRRRSLFFPAPDLLLPLGVEGLPKPIEVDNEAAHAALNAWREARETSDRLDSEAAAAPAFDEAAHTAALAAGEPDPEPTVAVKREEADAARARAGAAERVACNRISALYSTVEDNREAYLAWARERAESTVDPLLELPRTILDQVAAAAERIDTHKLAEKWHDNPTSAALSTGESRVPNLRAKYERAIERARSKPHPQLDDIPTLLAHLTLRLEELKQR